MRKILETMDDGMVVLDNPEHWDCEDCAHSRYCPATRMDPSESWCERDNDYFGGGRYINEDGEEEGCEDYMHRYDEWDRADELYDERRLEEC